MESWKGELCYTSANHHGCNRCRISMSQAKYVQSGKILCESGIFCLHGEFWKFLFKVCDEFLHFFVFVFSLLLILSIIRPWNKPCDLNLQSKSKTFFSMFTRFTVLRFFPHYFYSFKANTNVVCSRQIPQNHNIL